MLKNICVITGTRAEYGLLYWLMKGIQKNPNLELQIIATGMHLSPEFGLTYKEIEKDGFTINYKVEMLLSSDTPSSISKSTGLGLIGMSDAYSVLQPDMVILLGDRYELLAASTAALISRIPIGHIHGGETTEGAFDEAIRHSITKMAWWHFVACEEYKKRVIQLGEDPKRVYLVGGMGVDGIKKTKLLNKIDLEKAIDFKFGKKNILVTFHPVTLEKETSKKQFKELLVCLDELNDTNIIFTLSNSDTNGRIINSMIHNFVNNHSSNTKYYASMGHLNYLSTLQFIDGIVGNSSSGLLEAPTFKIGTINIGDRQEGRIKAKSIIDCEPKKNSIKKAIQKLYSPDFQKNLLTVKNLYGNGHASDKIVDILSSEKLPDQIKKHFFNL